tara:strand:- start:297 stop:539 length:243 start_codon:yes stop_codon:yes gene_type:complete
LDHPFAISLSIVPLSSNWSWYKLSSDEIRIGSIVINLKKKKKIMNQKLRVTIKTKKQFKNDNIPPDFTCIMYLSEIHDHR